MSRICYNPGPDSDDENFTMTPIEAEMLKNNYTGPSTMYRPAATIKKYDLWWLPTVICFLLAFAVLLVFKQ